MTDEGAEMTETTEPLLPSEAAVEAVATSRRRRRPSLLGPFRRTGGGVAAVGAKELRGRMRGRRAFLILSLYLVLLAGFAWMVELIMERGYQSTSGANGAFATAAIGQGIFAALLMLETLLVAFLAPMATAGSISLEREKQTLEMLAATPITSAAIVLGKLLSALVYVWLLIAASIPLTAVVFVFGGVAPDDLLHGYLVLVVTALGLGSFGLLCSSLVKRTQAATAITIFGVLAISVGSLFAIVFWQALSTVPDTRNSGVGTIPGSAPAPLVYLNPFLAQLDVAPADALCSSSNGLPYYCRFRETFLGNQNGIVFIDGNGVINGKVLPVPANVFPVGGGIDVSGPVPVTGTGGGISVGVGGPADVVPFGASTEAVWGKTVIAWLVLSAVFLALAIQLVSPTRRWRGRRPHLRRPHLRGRRRAAGGVA